VIWKEKLMRLKPCGGARQWLESQTDAETAWNSCEQADWLIWLALVLRIDRRMRVMAACQIAKAVLKHTPNRDEPLLRAIETAKAWSQGAATEEDCYLASRGAWDVADTHLGPASQVGYAAAYTCYLASGFDYNSYDAAVVSHAADAAVAASSDREADGARAAFLKASADIVRKHITFAMIKEAAGL